MKISAGPEEQEVMQLIRLHHQLTGSKQAERALANWPTFMKQCVKVMPTDYKAVLEELEKSKAKGQTVGV